MIERLTISSINQFVDLARKNPDLLSIGNFNLLKPAVDMKPASSCNCNKKAGADATIYRPQMEAALAMLNDTGKSQMKSVLKAKQICYYTKNAQGQVKQTCF